METPWHPDMFPPFFRPDTSSPPPSCIPGYGSRLYPQDALINPFFDTQEQLRNLAHTCRTKEQIQLFNVKSSDYLAIRARYGMKAKKRPYCCTCSEINLVDEKQRAETIKYHNHSSSLRFRIEASLDQCGQYRCLDCKQEIHHYKSSTRIPLLVSSSTLHAWAGHSRSDYPGTPFHLDYLTVPGARLDDLRQAVFAEYSKSELPIDITLVAGLNDVMQNRSLEDIFYDLSRFKSMVQEWNPENTFAICTLPYPPKITYLKGDPAYHRRTLIQDGSDKLHLLQALTTRIINLNLEGNRPDQTRRAPRFHTWGLKSSPSVHGELHRSLGSLDQHRRSQWRETNSIHQLHLSNQVRIRMGKAVVNYYTKIYDLDQAPIIEPQDPAQFCSIPVPPKADASVGLQAAAAPQEHDDYEPEQHAPTDPAQHDCIAPSVDIISDPVPSVSDVAKPHISDWTQEDEDEHIYFLEITPREDELKLLDESDDDEVEPLPLDHSALLDQKDC
jgi:hypothetical protein